MPPPTPFCRLNLGDLAIGIGAVAVFLALARRSWLDPPHGQRSLIFGAGNYVATFPGIFPVLSVEITGQGLVVASLALIALRLRAPHPPWRRLTRQPGWIAATAGLLSVTTALTVDRLQNSCEIVHHRSQSRIASVPSLRQSLFPDEAALACGLAVVVAWLVVWGTGVCRPERSTIDRLGRLVGLGWIVLPLARLGYGVIRVVRS